MSTTSLPQSLNNFIIDEWANNDAMEREAISKGRHDEMPPTPTWASAMDSLSQMPDDIVRAVTGEDGETILALLQAQAQEHGLDSELPEPDYTYYG